MIILKIRATPTKVEVIEKKEDLTAGSINRIKCEFDLSEEYEGCVIRAVFNHKFVKVENGICYANNLTAGKCLIGLYAYKTDSGAVTQRLSPTPCVEFINEGSYNSDYSEAVVPASTELEEHYNLISELLKSKNSADTQGPKGDKGDKGDTGPQGEQGPPGTTDYTELYRKPREILTLSGEVSIYSLNDGVFDIGSDFYIVGDGENQRIDVHSGDILALSRGSDSFMALFCVYGFYQFDLSTENWGWGYIPNSKDLESAFEEISGILEIINTLMSNVNSTKLDKPLIDNSNHNTVTLSNNTDFRFDEKSELTLDLPNYIDDDFHCSVVFDSGATPTILTTPTAIRFIGDDCVDGHLVPQANTGYEVDIKYLGNDRIIARVGAF